MSGPAHDELLRQVWGPEKSGGAHINGAEILGHWGGEIVYH